MADLNPAPGAMSVADKIKSYGTIVVTGAIFLMIVAWMIAVWTHVGDAPVYKGNTVSYDVFLRTKDILVLLLPLLTTAVGYWLGSQGTAAAQKKAEVAENKADEAQKKAADAASEAARRQGQLDQLEKSHPQAFRG